MGTLFSVTWQPHRRGVLERMGTCICVTESLCCSPETITTLFVNQLYPNTKLKVKEKRFIDVLQELTHFHCYLILFWTHHNIVIFFCLWIFQLFPIFVVIKMSLWKFWTILFLWQHITFSRIIFISKSIYLYLQFFYPVYSKHTNMKLKDLWIPLIWWFFIQ